MSAWYVYLQVYHECYVHALVLLMPVRMSVFRMIWSFPRPSYIGSALLQVRVCLRHTRAHEMRGNHGTYIYRYLCISIKAAVFLFSSTLCWMSKISWPLQVEKKPPLEIISTFSKGITLTPTHSSSLWVKVANCLAEGSSLKSLWLDGCQKLFLLRNVSDLYMIRGFSRNTSYSHIHQACG